MTTAVQHRRGTTAEHSTFTGLEGEVTIDTTKDTAVIHDGSLAGGYPLAKETLANVNPSTLSAITGAATASDDLFLMYDTSALAMKKISRAELNNAITIEALDTVDINGGTIDGTAIGGTTPAAGAFTSLSATSLTNTGNTTLGNASTDTVTVNGYMGVGGAPATNIGLYLTSTALTGSTGHDGIYSAVTGTSSATSRVAGFVSQPGTAAASYTTADVIGIRLRNATKGAGSTITNQHGAYIDDQTQGTNNYGISSRVSSGTNKWNIYASGTAANYFAGNVGIGTTSPSSQLTLSSTASSNRVSIENSNASGFPGLQITGPSVVFRAEVDSGSNLAVLKTTTAHTLNLGSNNINRLTLATTEAVFNDPGNDYDFRVESDTNTHALFVEGSSGNVGIGTSSPSQKLHLVDSDPKIQLTRTSDFYYGQLSADGFAAFTNTNGSAPIIFKTATTERLRIDSSGNLGLGVTPSAWGSAYKAMHLGTASAIWGSTGGNHDTNVGSNIYYNGANNVYITSDFATQYQQYQGKHIWFIAPSGTAGNAISFSQVMTLDASGKLFIGGTSDSALDGAFGIVVGGSSQSSGGVAIESSTSQWLTYTNSDQAMIFYDARLNAERARIDSSGNLLVGTTSSNSGRMDVEAQTGGIAISFRRNTGVYGSNTVVGTIACDSSSTAYNTSSDYRLKNTIAPMTGALAKVALLKPCTYKWNADGSDGEGFIAHELAEVVPQCVTGEKDAVDADGNPVYQGIDTSFLVATLTAAIQEQQAIIEDLKSRLTAAGL